MQQGIARPVEAAPGTIGPASPESPGASHVLTKKVVQHNVVTNQQKVPAWQWYWLMLLVVWALLLAVVPSSSEDSSKGTATSEG